MKDTYRRNYLRYVKIYLHRYRKKKGKVLAEGRGREMFRQVPRVVMEEGEKEKVFRRSERERGFQRFGCCLVVIEEKGKNTKMVECEMTNNCF